MAFTLINNSEIAAGEPLKQSLMQKIKNNFDDHESRVSSLETSSLVFQPYGWTVVGKSYLFGSSQLKENHKFILTHNLTMTNGRLKLMSAGVSGVLQVDVLFKRGASPYASIFSALPTIAAPGTDGTSNTGTLSTITFLTGDIFKLNIVTQMVGLNGFMVYLEYVI